LTDVFKPFPERRGLYRPSAARAAPARMPDLGTAAPKLVAMAGR
jgi:chemotaxis protein methyltransferase CheR